MARSRSHDPYQVDLLTLQAVIEALPPLAEQAAGRADDVASTTDAGPTEENIPPTDVVDLAVAGADVSSAATAPTAREPDELGAAIRTYRATGDERALAPVMTFFRRRFHVEAQRQARLGGRAAPLDTSDAQSAGFEALVGAINHFEPDAGIPFLAYFKQFHRAAMNEERSRLGGIFTLSRKMHQTRVAVLRAAEEVRKEQRSIAPSGPSQRKFQLPLALDDGRLALLDGTDLPARRAVLKTIHHALVRHFQAEPGWSDSVRGTMRFARAILQVALAESTASTRPRLEYAIGRALTVPATQEPFKFSRVFTPAAFADLESRDRLARGAALHTLIAEVDAYLARSLPGLRPDTRRRVAVERVDHVRGAGWSSSHHGLESNLHTRLASFLALVARRGLSAVEGLSVERSEAQAQFIAEVARRAGTSKQLAGHLLRLDTYGLSLDAPVEGKGGGEAGTVGERLIGERDPGATEQFWRVVQMLPFVPAGPRALMMLNLGLDGRRRLSVEELREVTGLPSATISRALDLPAEVGRDPRVIAHVDGPEAARVAKEQAALTAFRQIADAFVSGRPPEEAPTSAPVAAARVRAATVSQLTIFDVAAPGPALPTLVESP